MNIRRLNRQAFGLLAGFFLQFIAGMTLNLFVAIPDSHAGDSGSNYFARSWHSLTWAISGGGGWVLSFHVVLGLLLAIGSVGLLTSSLLARDKTWSVAGGIAALLTVGAFFHGMSFIDFNNDLNSMIMAVSWIGAVTSITVGLLVSVKRASRVTN